MKTSGRKIEKLVHELQVEIEKYLSFTNNEVGHPLQKRKQLQVLTAVVSVGLPSLNLHATAEHRKWLRFRPNALVVR